MTGIAQMLGRALAVGEPAVLVTVADALGSTPREAGARMLVGARRTAGTIGGGRLEHEAIAAARRLIEGVRAKGFELVACRRAVKLTFVRRDLLGSADA